MAQKYINQASIKINDIVDTYIIEPTLYGIATTTNEGGNYTVVLNNFGLVAGATAQIKFTTTNKANATLNINSTGAKTIFYNGAEIGLNQIQADHVYTMVYDNTLNSNSGGWQIVGNIEVGVDTWRPIGTGPTDAMAGNTIVNRVGTTAVSNNVNYKLLMSAGGATLTSGENYEVVYDSSITVNPSTHTITATTFQGALSGNANTATAIQTAGTTAQFYRGDNTWSNIIKQTANTALGIDGTTLLIGTARKDLNFDISNGSGSGVNDGYAGGITWGSGSNAYAGIYYQTSGNYGTRLIFATTNLYDDGSKARMIITSGGYVGIGTLTPATLFSVKGTSTLRHILPESNNTYDIGSTDARWHSTYLTTSLLVGAANTITAYNSNALGSFVGPGVFSSCITTVGEGYGYFLMGGGQKYGRMYIRTIGGSGNGSTLGTLGETILELGNGISQTKENNSGTNNSQGYLWIYGPGQDKGQLTYNNNSMFESDKSLYFSNNNNNGIANEVRGIMGGSDYWRIAGGATAADSGYVEVATYGDANEPIYIRQYNGATTFGSLVRTLTLLDASGNTSIPGDATIGTVSSPQALLVNGTLEVTSISQLTGNVTIGKNVTSTNNNNSITTSSGSLGLAQTDCQGLGISLYGGPKAKGSLTYGIMLASKDTFGTLGSVTGSNITYFTTDRNDTYGWIFKSNGGAQNVNNNVTSIAGNGNIYTIGTITSGILYPKIDSNNTITIGSSDHRWHSLYLSDRLFVGSAITDSTKTTNGSIVTPGKFYTYITSSTISDGNGYYLYGNPTNENTAEYGHMYIQTLGTASDGNIQGTQGEVYLKLGNSTKLADANTTSGANNARGHLILYHTDDHYGQYSSNRWDGNGSLSTYSMVGETKNTVNSDAWTILELGNSASKSTTTPHSQGSLRIYSSGSTYTDIRTIATSQSNIFYLQNYNGNMYAIHAGNTSQIGNGKKPVYIAANGRVTVCDITVGDIYTPIYSNAGELAEVSPIQRINFTFTNLNNGSLSLTHNAITANTEVIEIVVTAGHSYLNSAISWSVQSIIPEDGEEAVPTLTLSATVNLANSNNTITGYILIGHTAELSFST